MSPSRPRRHSEFMSSEDKFILYVALILAAVIVIPLVAALFFG
jgi:hypothetical protein